MEIGESVAMPAVDGPTDEKKMMRKGSVDLSREQNDLLVKARGGPLESSVVTVGVMTSLGILFALTRMRAATERGSVFIQRGRL